MIFTSMVNMYFLISLLTFILSLLITYLLIKFDFVPAKYAYDEINGNQKVHNDKIKRIGGLSVILSIIPTSIIFFFINEESSMRPLILIFFSCTLMFIIGFVEDLVKNISPIIRFMVILLFCFLVIKITDLKITKTEIQWIDFFLEIKLIALFITSLCIISSVNVINIMDGLNGLVGIYYIAILLILVNFLVYEDFYEYAFFIMIFISALFGFLVFNWPYGKIFLGDGGAYFLGATLPLFLIFFSKELNGFNILNALILMNYPVWELLFTILRRTSNKISFFKADNLHMHGVVLKLINKKFQISQNLVIQNSYCSIIINLLALLPCTVMTYICFGEIITYKLVLIFFTITFVLYTLIYYSILGLVVNN